MKVLSLTQPWATLVAIGAKQYETRSWRTPYRGPLAIHAAKGLAGMSEKELLGLCRCEPFRMALEDARIAPGNLPRGVILCVVDLLSCERTDGLRAGLSAQERAFGDYDDGRYAWKLGNVRVLPEPIAARGQLGLWDCDDARLI